MKKETELAFLYRRLKNLKMNLVGAVLPDYIEILGKQIMVTAKAIRELEEDK